VFAVAAEFGANIPLLGSIDGFGGAEVVKAICISAKRALRIWSSIGVESLTFSEHY